MSSFRTWIGTLTLLTLNALGQRLIIVDGDRGPAPENAEPIQATIQLQDGQRYREAYPEDVFFDGQRFRLLVSSNLDGYLYALCLNSQGSSSVLYPNRSGAPVNHLAGDRALSIPERGWFQFDQEPGTERVYLLLSERPIAELERAGQRGGLVNRRTLDKYIRQGGGGNKGIQVRPDDGDLIVRRIDLQHETRQ